MKMFRIIVDSKSIQRSRGRIGRSRKIAAFLALERMKCSPRIFCRAFLQDKIDAPRFGRPNAKVRFVRTD